MSKIKNENSVFLETTITMFTVENGLMKILLRRKKEEPYKGYWELPNKILSVKETIEEATKEILAQYDLEKTEIEQEHTFSSLDRNPNNRTIAVSYVGFIDSKTIEIKKETVDSEDGWFNIDELPKLAYDHKEIIDLSVSKMKIRMNKTNIIKKLFPSDFTLPELQSTYESALNKKIDRRNFRKKFISLNLIEETGYKTTGGNGRPAKLYKFKSDIEETDLF